MGKNEIGYDDFLGSVDPAYREFVNKTHDFFTEHGCKIKIGSAKSGYVVSYNDGKTGRVIMNYVFRKAGMLVRIYGDFVNSYEDFLESLPAGMLKSVDKAPVCKRLIDPAKCNSRCGMGYDFTVGENHYQKCKYSSFMFLINDENVPYITAFIENEMRAREAV